MTRHGPDAPPRTTPERGSSNGEWDAMNHPARHTFPHHSRPAFPNLFSQQRTLEVGAFQLHERILLPRERSELPSHARPCILIVLAGELVDDFRRDQRSYGERAVALLPANLQGTRLAGGDGARILEIEVDPQRLDSFGVRTQLFERVRQFEGGELAVLALRVQRELHQMDEQSPTAIQGLLLELLSRAGREALQQRGLRAPLCLARAEAFIVQHFHEPIQLSHVAEAAGVHQVYLARVFRRFRHLSVGDAIRRRRVAYVIERLDAGEDSLADLAISAGFSDQSHLTRIFKQQTGNTPARYRSARRQLRALPSA